MKIAITVDNDNIIKSVSKCISEKVKYDGIIIDCVLSSVQGIVDNYKYQNNKLIELTDEEKQNIINKNKPTEYKEENLIDKLILDNINMQMQIDSLIQTSLGGF